MFTLIIEATTKMKELKVGDVYEGRVVVAYNAATGKGVSVGDKDCSNSNYNWHSVLSFLKEYEQYILPNKKLLKRIWDMGLIEKSGGEYYWTSTEDSPLHSIMLASNGVFIQASKDAMCRFIVAKKFQVKVDVMKSIRTYEYISTLAVGDQIIPKSETDKNVVLTVEFIYKKQVVISSSRTEAIFIQHLDIIEDEYMIVRERDDISPIDAISALKMYRDNEYIVDLDTSIQYCKGGAGTPDFTKDNWGCIQH